MSDRTEPPEVKTCDECGSLIVQAVHEFVDIGGGEVVAELVYACNCTEQWILGEERWPEHWPEPVER